MGFPKGASIPFGQARGQYPAREVAALIVDWLAWPIAELSTASATVNL